MATPFAKAVLVLYSLAALSVPVSTRALSGLEMRDMPNLDSDTWSKYIIAPKSRTVRPAKLHASNGTVDTPDGILKGGVTTFRRDKTNDTVPSITLDFGLNVVGIPTLVFEKASDNKVGVRVAFSETLEYLTDRSDFTRSDNGDRRTQGTDQYVVPSGGGTWTIQNTCLYENRYVCADGLHGFRYMKISLDALASDAQYATPNGTFTLKDVSLAFSGLLGTADTYEGWFESSDEQLNKFFYQSSYTNEMTIDIFRENDTEPRNGYSPTLKDKLVLHDGAKRDRDPYVGDIAVSGRTTYVTHASQKAAIRNVLADLADHQQPDGYIPPASILNYSLTLFDYTLWWISTSYDYILYTGDTDYLTTYFPAMQAALNTWYASKLNTTTNLISRGPSTNTGSGWGDYAFLPRTGAVTYYNALYIRCLHEAASLALLPSISNPSQAALWSAQAAKSSSALNTTNWNPSTSAFLDSPSHSPTRHAQDGNAMAILAESVTTPQSAKSALEYMSNATALPYGNAFLDDTSLVEDGNVRVYAFISYFDLEARFRSGLGDGAVEQIKRLYGWMDKTDPASTAWEGIGREGGKYSGGFTSCAHGWGTGVVPLMMNWVLGVRPVGVGFGEWVIEVPGVGGRGGVSWARGVMPTPRGGLAVSWRLQEEEGLVEVTVDVPEGTRGTVKVPVKKSGDGDEEPRYGRVVEDGFVVFKDVGAGRHTFTND